MKKVLFGGIFLSLMALSCSKDGDDEGTPDPNTATYLNSANASSWTYKTVDNTGVAPETEYTLLSTNRDSTINGKTYHVYVNSGTGESEYNAKVGNDYYIFTALPDELGGENEENLYLKAAGGVNSSWLQTYDLSGMGFPISAKIVHTIIEKGITRTVNSVVHNNVIHVKTDVVLIGVPPGTITFSTDIHEYYAPNYGMIETRTKINVDFMGMQEATDETVTLKTATLN